MLANSALSVSRRRLLATCSAAGLAPTLFPGALLALAIAPPPDLHPAAIPQDHLPPITPALIEAAESIAAITLTPAQRAMLVDGLTEQRASVEVMHSLHLPNSVAPAFIFDPLPAGFTLPKEPTPPIQASPNNLQDLTPEIGLSREEELAFATISVLAARLRRREITSVELTKLSLARLRRFDPQLHFVINFTEERALTQAAQADRELAVGESRGPLHGIPWGAKDLLAVKGYPTTWGAAGFEQQHFDQDATVVQRLDAAGAVLVAKLSLGALAQGDLWGATRDQASLVAAPAIPGTRVRVPQVPPPAQPRPSLPDAFPSPSAQKPSALFPVPALAVAAPASVPPSASSRAPAR